MCASVRGGLKIKVIHIYVRGGFVPEYLTFFDQFIHILKLKKIRDHYLLD